MVPAAGADEENGSRSHRSNPPFTPKREPGTTWTPCQAAATARRVPPPDRLTEAVRRLVLAAASVRRVPGGGEFVVT